MKVERYIREYAAAILRDKATDEQRKSTVQRALDARERGIITASEAMQILHIAAVEPCKRLMLAATSVFYDFENDELITLDQLRREWESMTQEEREERGGGTFDDFREACMYRNNGVLIPFTEWIKNRMEE